jgi:hypothetical protein
MRGEGGNLRASSQLGMKKGRRRSLEGKIEKRKMEGGEGGI